MPQTLVNYNPGDKGLGSRGLLGPDDDDDDDEGGRGRRRAERRERGLLGGSGQFNAGGFRNTNAASNFNVVKFQIELQLYGKTYAFTDGEVQDE